MAGDCEFRSNKLTQIYLDNGDVNKANSVKAKAKKYNAKARGPQSQGLIVQGQGQGLTLQR